MTVSLEQVLMGLGLAALLVAALLLSMALRTFFREDVRGALDDLSGRRRVRELAEERSRHHSVRVPARRPSLVTPPTAEEDIQTRVGGDAGDESSVTVLA